MAFEDLWPFYGDFDMNDLVVDVRFNRVTNAQNNVVDLINTYQVKAVGGSFKNGFAFQLDQVSIGSVASVTGTVLSGGSYVSLSASGLENGTDKPVIFVYDDAERVIHRAGGSFFNTENNGLTGTSDLVTITVNFATPQPVANIGLPPYNHFIVKNKVREHEIHLPNQIPTSKADPALFGTGNDDSNPGTGKYYKSATNLPWAIFIAESFDYPVEKADISTAHLKFAAWAQSSGTQFPDWYLDEPGYRNPANIYGN
jgi:LruC domain-containing protein